MHINNVKTKSTEQPLATLKQNRAFSIKRQKKNIAEQTFENVMEGSCLREVVSNISD